RRQRTTMVEANLEILKSQPSKNFADGGQKFGFHHGACGPDGVNVALIELAEPAPGRPVGAPDRLNLIALNKPRQLVLILRDDARQRHRQVVPQGKVGYAARLVVAAAENLEDQLVAFFAVLPEQ